MRICTIVARNYVPAARVLTDSFLEQHRDGAVSVLVLDDLEGEIDSGKERFEVLRPEDLFEDTAELHRMEAIYELTEFATSMKPWLLRHLLERGEESVLYLDPDIRVFDRLDELFELAESTGIVLTPHARAPLPRDQRMTSESAILAVGVYNLGFIGLGKNAGGLLDFWQERLRRECRNDPGNMRFVDQRWIDFVPGMFDSSIVRDPRFNVAYWNLHEREVEWTGEGYEVEGRPLGFFHFSGYSPKTRHILSRHQVERPRILLSENPSLVKLFGEYGDALEASGFGTGSTDYALGYASNGLVLDKHVRRVYLDRLLEWEAGRSDDEAPPPDPFEPEGARGLVEWLNTIVPSRVGPSRLTRYEATLYAFTPELHAEFPDPQGADFVRFREWIAEEGRSGRVDPLLVTASRPELAGTANANADADGSVVTGWTTGRRPEPGITIAGYLGATHSIGELGRLMEEAVRASGIRSQSVVFDPEFGVSRLARTPGRPSAARRDLDTNLVVVNADQLPRFASSVGQSFFDGRYTIGNWAWELEEFPSEWQSSFDLVDEVWAISQFTKNAIAAATDKPVLAMTPPVVAPVPAAGIGRAELGLPEGRFVFLFCFDLQSVIERKNPLGLIRAFSSAFEPGEGPVLVVKTINGESRPMDLEMVRVEAMDRSDIYVMDGVLPADHLGSLMAAADCYVSLHRSEGLGLTMAESMALGKPVIATGYSGNMDFMNEQNSFLVPFSWTEVPSGSGPYPVGARWAEPDLEVAARQMRVVVDQPDKRAERASAGRVEVEQLLSVFRRAEAVRERFEAIASSGVRARSAAVARRNPAVAGGAPRTALRIARSTAAGLAGRRPKRD